MTLWIEKDKKGEVKIMRKDAPVWKVIWWFLQDKWDVILIVGGCLFFFWFMLVALAEMGAVGIAD
jgi:hypothetical protein